MNKKILFLTLLGVLILPALASAETPELITTIIESVEQTVLFVASGIVVILWVVTGLLFLSAQGAPEKLNLAKKSLFAAVAGTILIILAESALLIIQGAIGVGE